MKKILEIEKDARLEDIVMAIDKWCVHRAKRGENPVIMASFGITDGVGKSIGKAGTIYGGDPEDVVELMKYTNNITKRAVAERKKVLRNTKSRGSIVRIKK